MASPPAASPSTRPHLALPRQLPHLALPSKSRKSPLAPSSGSAHPLRQTSYPPPDSLEAQHRLAQDQAALEAFSPGAGDSLDGFSDSEIVSAISGPNGDEALGGGASSSTKKRKRGGGGDKAERRGKGRPAKAQQQQQGSLVNGGEDGRSWTGQRRRGTTGAPSVLTAGGDAEDEEDEDDDDLGGAAADGEAITSADIERDNQHRALFRETIKAAHQERYDFFSRAKLEKTQVKKLVNATLSQSVPPNIVVAVMAYTKMFAGMLIEGARDVQAEWLAVRAPEDGEEESRAAKRLRIMRPGEDGDAEGGEHDKVGDDKAEGNQTEAEAEAAKENPSKKEPLPNDTSPPPPNPPNSSEAAPVNPPPPPPTTTTTLPPPSSSAAPLFPDLAALQPGAWGLSKYICESDRGPLQPDHLRESLRRYRKSRIGGVVGFTGLSLQRPEGVAARGGGRGLFR